MSEQEQIQEWKPSGNPWLMILPVMLATFMYALDETVANVALPHIAGSYSVSSQESIWVLTSYLMASSIVIPMIDFFCKFIGRKNFFMLGVLLFTIASFLCGISNSIGMIVVARALQGMGGGCLMPMAQAVCMESFTGEGRNKAMAVFGLVVIVAPILGPVMGGWITENWSWPYIFFINVPVGFICITLAKKSLEDPPYARKQKNVHLDKFGFMWLCIWLIPLQVVFDKGNDADWFNAPWICWLTAIAVFGGIMFFYSQVKGKNPLVKLDVLKDSNYLCGTAMIIMINVTKEPIGIGSFQVGSYYLAITRESMSEAIRVFCVALASVSCMYFLTLSTPMIDILTALGQLHVPRLLIEMMLLLYRFIFLIFDMTNAITTAQKCRLSDINFKTKLTSMSKMLAATLIKSLQASNRLYDALESRGYTGTIEVIEPDYWLEKRQVVYAVVFELGVCLLACINWRMR